MKSSSIFFFLLIFLVSTTYTNAGSPISLETEDFQLGSTTNQKQRPLLKSNSGQFKSFELAKPERKDPLKRQEGFGSSMYQKPLAPKVGTSIPSDFERKKIQINTNPLKVTSAAKSIESSVEEVGKTEKANDEMGERVVVDSLERVTVVEETAPVEQGTSNLFFWLGIFSLLAVVGLVFFRRQNTRK